MGSSEEQVPSPYKRCWPLNLAAYPEQSSVPNRPRKVNTADVAPAVRESQKELLTGGGTGLEVGRRLLLKARPASSRRRLSDRRDCVRPHAQGTREPGPSRT